MQKSSSRMTFSRRVHRIRSRSEISGQKTFLRTRATWFIADCQITYQSYGSESMRRYLLSPLLGLAIVISCLATTTPANAFALRNLYYGTCLGVSVGRTNTGTNFITWNCDGSPSQNFWTTDTYTTNSRGEELYVFNNGVAENRVLGVTPGGTYGWSSQVITWTADGSDNQKWTLVPVTTDFQGNQCYAIASNGGKYTMLTPYRNVGYAAAGYGSYGYYDYDPQTIYGYYDHNPNYGYIFRGDSVVADSVIDSYVSDPAVQPPTYDPRHYAAQYWCAI